MAIPKKVTREDIEIRRLKMGDYVIYNKIEEAYLYEDTVFGYMFARIEAALRVPTRRGAEDIVTRMIQSMERERRRWVEKNGLEGVCYD